ncbi:MAG TPA: low molecular weight phosphatase family protein [Intrasporangiaceae bacterium]|nr:low molecular weight phosphatase family protein [Intrasporangiaceae bacterium]
MRILYVCTANISRSPYAQVRTSELFEGQLQAASAGIPGTTGRRMDPAMEAQLPFEDDEALNHRSRVLSAEILDASDLILTMEFAHHMRILDAWPDSAHKVFGLRQFVDGIPSGGLPSGPEESIRRAADLVTANSMMLDIEDPYGRGQRAARDCAGRLDRLILGLGVGLGCQPVPED